MQWTCRFHIFRGRDGSKLYTFDITWRKKQKTSPSSVKFEEPTKSENPIKLELIHRPNKCKTYRLE